MRQRSAKKMFKLVTILTGICCMTEAVQVVPCPTGANNPLAQGNYYISDDINRCVFYWCWRESRVKNTNGALTFRCPDNRGTAQGYHGRSNPCTETVTACIMTTDGGRNGVTSTSPQPTTTLPPSTTQSTVANTGGTTRSPASGQKQIRDVLPGRHALLGTPQAGLIDLSSCFYACLIAQTCMAFDFNVQERSCYFHTEVTSCGQIREKQFCAHYRFFNCAGTGGTQSTSAFPTTTTTVTTTTAPTTTTTATTTSTTPIPSTSGPTQPATSPTPQIPSFIQTFRGFHLLGGVAFIGAQNAYACLMACVENALCVGVDYDNRTNSCFFHDQTTECERFVAKPYCTHYRIIETCPSTTQSVPQTSTTTTTTTSAPALPVPGGFVSAQQGYHLLDGFRLEEAVSEQQCLDACLAFPRCLAADYNLATNECFAHNTTTYCTEPVAKPFCRHYKRSPCVDDGNNDIIEVRGLFHTLGGSEICTNCSREDCLLRCAQDFASVCQGVDYDERNMGCYMHTAGTICGAMRMKDYCTHYSRIDCDPELPPITPFPSNPVTMTPAPTGYPAPPSPNFMPINFMGPSGTIGATFSERTRNTNGQPPTRKPLATLPLHINTRLRTVQSTHFVRPVTKVTIERDKSTIPNLVSNVQNTQANTVMLSNNKTATSNSSLLITVLAQTSLPTIPAVPNSAIPNQNIPNVFPTFATIPTITVSTTESPTISKNDVSVPPMISQPTSEETTPVSTTDFGTFPNLITSATFTTSAPIQTVPQTLLPNQTPATSLQAVTIPRTASTTVAQSLIINFNQPMMLFDPLDDILMEANLSVIPSMWSIYPGMFMTGGSVIAGPGITGDMCVQTCDSNPACVAVDFNSEDGLCEEHFDASAKCQILVSASGRYHMKKPPVCDFFSGTTIAYPAPFSVAP